MSNIDRKLRLVTRSMLKRVMKAKAETEFPELELFTKESRLGMRSDFLYRMLPEGAARFLGKVLPKSETVQSVISVWDYREKHGFPPGYIPAGYQLPPKDQG